MENEDASLLRIVVLTLLGTGIGLFISNSPKGPGREVYNGNIGDKKVVYFERGDQNQMSISDPNAVYTLIDHYHSKNVEDQNFTGQSIERIIVEENSKKETFDRTSERYTSPRQEYTERLFEKADKLYNDTRAQIREQIKAEYKRAIEKFPQ